MAETGGAFRIQELDGDKRLIILVGRALPYRDGGFSAPVEQRANVTWIPGSPVGTLTLLGGKETDSSISGMWKQKYLNPGGEGPYPALVDGSPVTVVHELVSLFEKICLYGTRLDVTWMSVARVGIIRKFTPTWKTHLDVEWTIDFEWISRGQEAGALVSSAASSISDIASVTKAKFDLLDFIKLPLNFPLYDEFVRNLVDTINKIQDFILDLENFVQNLSRKVTYPARALRGLASIVMNVGNEAGLIVDDLIGRTSLSIIGTQASVSVSAAMSVDGAAAVTPAQKLEAERYKREMLDWAQELKRVANEYQDALSKQIEGEVDNTYRATDGDTLQNVSQRFYNTPHEWRRLMTYNGFESAVLSAGQLVFVPKLNTADAGGGV